MNNKKLISIMNELEQTPKDACGEAHKEYKTKKIWNFEFLFFKITITIEK